MTGFATPGGTEGSGDVEEDPLSLALEDQDVQASRAGASALAPRLLADARSVIADSDVRALDAAVSLMGSGDLREASAGIVISVIGVFRVVLTPAAASAEARSGIPEEDARPLERPEGAEGTKGAATRSAEEISRSREPRAK